MLEGIREADILVGAYTDNRGGVCPMLAAHRRGGRTEFISFARAWDRFAGAVAGRPRHASQRELLVLSGHLEASLMAEEDVDLGSAIAEHRRLVERREQQIPRPEAQGARPGDANRQAELRDRHGWAWLRPFRRLDEYERALERVRRPGELPAERGRPAQRELELV
jgi:hypothetical protein